MMVSIAHLQKLPMSVQKINAQNEMTCSYLNGTKGPGLTVWCGNNRVGCARTTRPSPALIYSALS